MEYTELEAALASLNTVMGEICGDEEALLEAMGIAADFDTYGVTKESYDKLKALYPNLSDSGLQLSSMPIRIGAESIGNEAVSSMSGGAIAAILGAVAVVLGLIMSKIFGGGSSGGSGGGGISSKVKKLEDAKFAFNGDLFGGDGISISRKGKVLSDSDAKMMVNSGAHALETMSDGGLDVILKDISSLISSLALMTTKGTDDAAVASALSGDCRKINTELVKMIPICTTATAAAMDIPDGKTDIDSIADARAKAIGKSNDISVNVYSNKLPSKGMIELSQSNIVRVEDSITKLIKEIKSTQSKVSGGTKVSKESSKAIISTLKILGLFLTKIISPYSANARVVLDRYLDAIGKAAKVALDLYKSQSDDVKADICKAVGASNEDVIKATDKGDIKDGELIAELLKVIPKKVTLTKEQQATLDLDLSKAVK